MEDNLTRYLDTESSEGTGNREFAKEIQIDPSAVVRIVDPENVIKCWKMWPLCDDGKKRSFIIGNEYEGDSLLAKVLGDYLPYKYFKGGILESEKDELTGQKRYIYEAQDPELFLQLLYNGDKSGNNGSWRPTRDFVFNAIDRSVEPKGDFMNQLWCVVNKHTKLLKMPITGFEKLKSLIEQDGRLDEYDIYYTKTGSGRNTKHEVFKAGKNNTLAFFGFITEEEALYEKYDLKKECALSSATYILKYLSMTIQRIDSILKTNFFDQLVAQSQLEKEAWGIADEGALHDIAQIPQQTVVPPQTQFSEAQLTQQQIVTPATPGRQVLPQTGVPITPNVQVQGQVISPTQVQATPVSQQVQTRKPAGATVSRVPINDAPKVVTINCPYCQTEVPENAEVCPQCNNKLMEPCGQCNTLFSILSTTCPNTKCGAVYKLG